MTILLIVENDTFAATFMKGSLNQLHYTSIHIAENASSAMQMFRQIRPNACLLDIELGSGPTGIDVARAMRKIDSKVGITFLTSIQDPRLINLKGLELPLGSKYLAKKSVVSTEHISRVITESIEMATIGTQFDLSEIQSDLNLTPGQFELVRMIAEGLSNREIANQKVMTVKSTENAIARLAKKLKITDTASASQRVLIAKRYFEFIGKV